MFSKIASHRRQLIWFLAVCAVAALAPGAAFAQGWLVGASAGMAKQYDYSVGGEIANSDDTDVGFRVYGGYLFHPNFGVALSWVDLGAMNYDGPAFGGFTDELEAQGLDLSFLAGFRPGQQEWLSLFAVAGAFFWKQDVHYVDDSGTFDYKDDGTSPSVGVGAEFALGSAGKWGINVEYERFFDVGDENNSGHEYDRDLISAGVHYRFGK